MIKCRFSQSITPNNIRSWQNHTLPTFHKSHICWAHSWLPKQPTVGPMKAAGFLALVITTEIVINFVNTRPHDWWWQLQNTMFVRTLFKTFKDRKTNAANQNIKTILSANNWKRWKLEWQNICLYALPFVWYVWPFLFADDYFSHFLLRGVGRDHVVVGQLVFLIPTYNIKSKQLLDMQLSARYEKRTK